MVEGEVVEVAVCAVLGEVHGAGDGRRRRRTRRGAWPTRAGESIGRMNSQTAARSALFAAGEGVAQLARHALGAERLGAGDAVGVEEERGGPAGDELARCRAAGRGRRARARARRRGSRRGGGVRGGRCRRRAAGALGRSSRRRRRSARGWCWPSRRQTISRSALSWSWVGSVSAARMSWPRPRLLAVASAWRARSAGAALPVVFGGVAQLVVVEARAGEVRLLARGSRAVRLVVERWRMGRA